MVAAAADDWMRSALRDGEVVADMLLRLKEAKVTPTVFENPAVTALRWGIRQPRSRSPRCDGVAQRKEADSAKSSRCSPSTPLSWSGGCGGSSSPSGYADGYEATSRQTSGSLAVGSRSKTIITRDSNGSSSNRGRKKKTFAELEEEEDNLLKERICLKREIALFCATFDEHDTEIESLKKMKLDPKHMHRNKGEVEKSMSERSFLLPDLNMTPSSDDS